MFKLLRRMEIKRNWTVIKTICAFLNSDGGLLIWSAPKEVEIEGIKYAQEAQTPVTYEVEKDAIISRTADELSPTPLRIKFHAIELAPGEFCYLFEVVKSDFAPHQFKGTYYMRMDGSTRTAPHHYVEALIKKVSYPKLECYATFGILHDFETVTAMPLQITVHNMSKVENDSNIYYRILFYWRGHR